MPYRQIAKQFGVTTSSLTRHKRHMAKHLVPATKTEEVAKADRLMSEVERLTRHVNKMLAACDEYLTDPDNPKKYDIGPRAEDIEVVYLEHIEGKRVRKKKLLSELLELIEGQGTPLHVRYKIADPRELLLKTVDRLHNLAELLARVTGELREAQMNIQINQIGVAFLPERLTPEEWIREHGGILKGDPEGMDSSAETETGS